MGRKRRAPGYKRQCDNAIWPRKSGYNKTRTNDQVSTIEKAKSWKKKRMKRSGFFCREECGHVQVNTNLEMSKRNYERKGGQQSSAFFSGCTYSTESTPHRVFSFVSLFLSLFLLSLFPFDIDHCVCFYQCVPRRMEAYPPWMSNKSWLLLNYKLC